MRRFLGLFALAAMMASTAMPAAAAGTLSRDTSRTITRGESFHGSKSPSGRIAQSDRDLLARRDGQLIGVLIKLDVDALASYKGGIDGLQATSPSVTGKAVTQNPAAVNAYKGYLNGKANAAAAAIRGAIAGAKIDRTFLTAFGGFAARVPANQAKNLLKIDGVSAVMYDTTEHITANDSPNFVGASALWPSLGGENHAGQGVKVGVLDTGIWPEHPMLADPGIPYPGGKYGCEFGLSGEPYDPAFACNDKLIGAYAFLDTNLLFTGPGVSGEYCPDVAHCSARDADGHGTHTSTTAAGSPVNSSVLLGVDRGHISGIAPGASVIMYRVCDTDGCFSSDSMAAVEQAITDDVDVLNFSISGGADPYSDGVELAFLDAYAAGILVNASAGNSGPGPGTTDHGGPWTNTVGASTLDRQFGSVLHLANGATMDLNGATVTSGVPATPLVWAGDAPYSDELCATPPAPGTFAGKVVACRRGSVARILKGYNMMLGGAVGMVLYNVGPTDLETDNHFLPAIHVNDPTESIKAFIAAHPTATAQWGPGVAGPAQGDVMASFSSRGPLGDFLKPDVTAPGVQILAGNTPHHLFDPAGGLGPQGEFYQAIAGTSMSSPHAAGVAALLKAAHPGWTPGEIKSAMITSAETEVVKEDGSTPADPFDMGGGSIRANRAASPTVVFDVTSAAYYASAGDPFGRINLNTATINAPNMPGMITTWRAAQNVTPVTQTLDITAQGPNGAKITVNPKVLTIGAFQTKSFFITIDGRNLDDGQYFGSITLNPRAAGYRNARLPVAFNKHPGSVEIVNQCASDTVAVGAEVACSATVTNLANSDANVSLRVKGPRSRGLLLNDWSAGNKKGNGFVWNGNLSPSLPPAILALQTPDGGPGGGYLSLTDFGIPGEGIFGDEDLVNYSVPGFSYGHELYDTVGVDSNGYLIVGGASESADNNCCDPSMPNPAKPNNVIAPYWTDLDPGSGGDLYLGILGDGVNDWLVVEWKDVPVFGTANLRSFQVWIQLGDTTMEGIWLEHGSTGPGAGTGLIVGAENRDGSSAATLGLNVPPTTLGYQVITGSPTPGGSMTINYDALGRSTGKYKILTTMVSDITQGTATDVDHIRVTP